MLILFLYLFFFGKVRSKFSVMFPLTFVPSQCLASWFSCQEISWIFEISCQGLGDYSWQGSQDFARFFNIVENNPRKFLDFLARKPRISKILARNEKKSKILAKNSRLSKIIQDLGKKTKTPSTWLSNHTYRLETPFSKYNPNFVH